MLVPLLMGIMADAAFGACPELTDEINGQIATLNLAETATDAQTALTYLRQADSEDRKMILECPHSVPTNRY